MKQNAEIIMIKNSPTDAIKMQSSNAKPDRSLCIPEMGLLWGAWKLRQAKNIQMKNAMKANHATGEYVLNKIIGRIAGSTVSHTTHEYFSFFSFSNVPMNVSRAV